jgi:hypothetical protein
VRGERKWHQRRSLRSGRTENSMVDDKTKRAPQDTKLISLEEEYEIDYWTERFGVSRDRLATAVRRVGHSAAAVEKYLTR